MIKNFIFLCIFVQGSIGHAFLPIENTPRQHTKLLAMQKKPSMGGHNTRELIKINIPDQHAPCMIKQRQANTKPSTPIVAKSESESFGSNQTFNYKAPVPEQLDYIPNTIAQRQIHYQAENNKAHLEDTLSTSAKKIADTLTKAKFEEKYKKMLDQYGQLVAEPTENILKKAGAAKVSTIEFIRLMFIKRYTKKTKELVENLYQKNIEAPNPDDAWNKIIEKAIKKNHIKVLNDALADEGCCSLQ